MLGSCFQVPESHFPPKQYSHMLTHVEPIVPLLFLKPHLCITTYFLEFNRLVLAAVYIKIGGKVFRILLIHKQKTNGINP